MFCSSRREGGSASKGNEKREGISSKLKRKEEPVIPQAAGTLPYLWSPALPTVPLPLRRAWKEQNCSSGQECGLQRVSDTLMLPDLLELCYPARGVEEGGR